MFLIDSDNTIHITRGDIAVIEVCADTVGGKQHIFQPGDVVRLCVHACKQPATVVLAKDVRVESETPTVDIALESSDTKLGDVISKPVDYWYEIELNPDTAPQTIVGYDSYGPKIFRVYPEGGDTGA